MPQVYDKLGLTYRATRHADARIAAQIHAMLPFGMTILNVGAGSGSYEPVRPGVVALEPSSTMLAQRAHVSPPAVQAVAEALPFPARSFDAVLAVLTLHHWHNVPMGLAECVRVARNRVVILTWDPDAPAFWLVDEYFPELYVQARSAFPSIDELRRCLGPVQVVPVPVPHDCHDGFLGAYWSRPEAYLNDTVRAGISGFALIGDHREALARLARDVGTGEWMRRHHVLCKQTELDVGYRLILADVS